MCILSMICLCQFSVNIDHSLQVRCCSPGPRTAGTRGWCWRRTRTAPAAARSGSHPKCPSARPGSRPGCLSAAPRGSPPRCPACPPACKRRAISFDRSRFDWSQDNSLCDVRNACSARHVRFPRRKCCSHLIGSHGMHPQPAARLLERVRRIAAGPRPLHFINTGCIRSLVKTNILGRVAVSERPSRATRWLRERVLHHASRRAWCLKVALVAPLLSSQ